MWKKKSSYIGFPNCWMLKQPKNSFLTCFIPTYIYIYIYCVCVCVLYTYTHTHLSSDIYLTVYLRHLFHASIHVDHNFIWLHSLKWGIWMNQSVASLEVLHYYCTPKLQRPFFRAKLIQATLSNLMSLCATSCSHLRPVLARDIFPSCFQTIILCACY